MALKSVRVPKQFEPLFLDAQQYVEKYFQDRVERPENGTITIGGERYVLVRAASMSVHFLDFIRKMYPALEPTESIEASSRVLFDMAHNIGLADAKAFHKSTGVTDPIAKLSTGPIHFAYTGWAYVDIFPESNPTADDHYYLIYDHPQSFEADAWIASGRKPDFCACFMNSGYSSGWCEESFSIKLIAREILCRARGDAHCRFIMAPPEKIDAYIESYLKQHPDLFARKLTDNR